MLFFQRKSEFVSLLGFPEGEKVNSYKRLGQTSIFSWYVYIYIYIYIFIDVAWSRAWIAWIRLVEMVHCVCPQKSSIQQELWTINIIWPHLPNQVTIQDHWAGAHITWQQTQHHRNLKKKKKKIHNILYLQDIEGKRGNFILRALLY